MTPFLSLSKSPRTGILLAGHGTRSLQGQAELALLAEQVAERAPEALVRIGFLELAEPSLDDAIDGLAAEGVGQVVVAPLLLFAAGHARQDLPAVVARARRRHPETDFLLAGHLGLHRQLVALSATRFGEAMASAGWDNPRQILWLMVGRGSLDPAATDEARQFLDLRRQTTPVADARLAFLAMAEPRIEQVLEAVRQSNHPAIVVQPHLLFHGDLLTRLQSLIGDVSAAEGRPRWAIAPHLGPGQAVAEVVLERVREARIAAGWSGSPAAGEA